MTRPEGVSCLFFYDLIDYSPDTLVDTRFFTDWSLFPAFEPSFDPTRSHVWELLRTPNRGELGEGCGGNDSYSLNDTVTITIRDDVFYYGINLGIDEMRSTRKHHYKVGPNGIQKLSEDGSPYFFIAGAWMRGEDRYDDTDSAFLHRLQQGDILQCAMKACRGTFVNQVQPLLARTSSVWEHAGNISLHDMQELREAYFTVFAGGRPSTLLGQPLSFLGNEIILYGNEYRDLFALIFERDIYVVEKGRVLKLVRPIFLSGETTMELLPASDADLERVRVHLNPQPPLVLPLPPQYRPVEHFRSEDR